jgi:hypothetical protein
MPATLSRAMLDDAPVSTETYSLQYHFIILLHAATSNNARKAIVWQRGNYRHQGCEMAKSESTHCQVLLLSRDVNGFDMQCHIRLCHTMHLS